MCCAVSFLLHCLAERRPVVEFMAWVSPDTAPGQPRTGPPEGMRPKRADFVLLFSASAAEGFARWQQCANPAAVAL